MRLATLFACVCVLTLMGCGVSQNEDAPPAVNQVASPEPAATVAAPPTTGYDGNTVGSYGRCYLYTVEHAGNRIYITENHSGNDQCSVAVVPAQGGPVR